MKDKVEFKQERKFLWWLKNHINITIKILSCFELKLPNLTLIASVFIGEMEETN